MSNSKVNAAPGPQTNKQKQVSPENGSFMCSQHRYSTQSAMDMEKLNLFMFHYNNVRNLQPAHTKFEQERKHNLPQSETVKWVHYFASIYKYNYSFPLLCRANSGDNEQLSFHQNDR